MVFNFQFPLNSQIYNLKDQCDSIYKKKKKKRKTLPMERWLAKIDKLIFS